jgi:hypothetical protein
VTLVDRITRFLPCEEATDWLSGHSDPQQAWEACERGDWMLWLLGHLSGPPLSEGRRPLVLAACECARLTLPHTKDGRVLVCIETAERWAGGEASAEELREAQADADAYAAAAADADAYAAAAADAYAAAAADADAYADADAARKKTQAECAVIVRRHYPKAPDVGA